MTRQEPDAEGVSGQQFGIMNIKGKGQTPDSRGWTDTVEYAIWVDVADPGDTGMDPA